MAAARKGGCHPLLQALSPYLITIEFTDRKLQEEVQE
jgi:hypothetical protein